MPDTSMFVARELQACGVVSSEELDRATQQSRTHRAPVLDTMVEMGLVSHRDVAISRAKICEYPFVDLAEFEIGFDHTRLLPRQTAERLMAFPLFQINRVATVAMADPMNLRAIDEIRQITKLEIDPVVCDTERLKSLMDRAYSMAAVGIETEDTAEGHGNESDGGEPIIAAVNQILSAAIESRASDVHLCPDERVLHLRFRIDGALRGQQGPSLSMHPPIVQRLKVLAKLDVTQTRSPQDGKFKFNRGGHTLDVRVSIIPTIHGENVVLRLLRPATQIGSLRGLEMPADIERWFETAIRRPHGMILVTGPTGSGKTTTLYTALSTVNSPDRNIMTIEDPVEIRLPMVRQVQVAPEIGLTFAHALRSMLRQDPDVMMIGEIRDKETAEIAIQSALTGHLVLSTLHTNDAVASVSRLRDFGIAPFAINAALVGSVAQRLVRRICEHCRIEREATRDDLVAIGLENESTSGFYRGVGCSHCQSSGYSGRVGVYEVMKLTRELREALDRDEPYTRLQDAAVRGGMRTMLDDGLDKARRGLTTVSELRRVIATTAMLTAPERSAA